VKTNHIDGAAVSLSNREKGQAVAEYAFMLGMLLIMVGLMTSVGVYLRHGFAWVASTLH
jgi:hypothetical protein